MGIKLLLLAALTIVIPANTKGYDADVDYMASIQIAIENNDLEAAKQLNEERNAKIDAAGSKHVKVDAEAMYYIAKIIECEAGSAWLSDDWKMSVGEVLLNRVASPEFPDTFAECVYQPGQYPYTDTAYFAAMRPSAHSVELARRLCEGERVLDDPTVVYQSGAVQGGGVATKYTDELLGATYFCYSSRPELYKIWRIENERL